MKTRKSTTNHKRTRREPQRTTNGPQTDHKTYHKQITKQITNKPQNKLQTNRTTQTRHNTDHKLNTRAATPQHFPNTPLYLPQLTHHDHTQRHAHESRTRSLNTQRQPSSFDFLCFRWLPSTFGFCFVCCITCWFVYAHLRRLSRIKGMEFLLRHASTAHRAELAPSTFQQPVINTNTDHIADGFTLKGPHAYLSAAYWYYAFVAHNIQSKRINNIEIWQTKNTNRCDYAKWKDQYIKNEHATSKNTTKWLMKQCTWRYI